MDPQAKQKKKSPVRRSPIKFFIIKEDIDLH